jgi:hypothetical protein
MNELRVGYGEKVITPPLGIDLCGYGFYLDRRAESVLDDLKARALVLQSSGRSLVLVSCDIIGLAVEDADAIRAEIAAAHRVPTANVLLAATHTHSGPATQPMPGLGDVDAVYMKRLRSLIVDAAAAAAGVLEPAESSFALEAIEPLGFNRRKKNFCGVDPVLKAAIFRTREKTIHLLNYACHAVVFGRKTHISADWPGAIVREIEKAGDQAVFFQGFCGDIDPVLQMNRWGEGTTEDLLSIGDLVRRRLEKAVRYAVRQPDVRLTAAEHRIELPLNVHDKRTIERQASEFQKKHGQFPGAGRFAEEWKARALEAAPTRRRSPRLRNVPVQALAVGGLKIIALPGEFFCEIGLKLQKTDAPLMPIGYANGNIGYIPTDKDFRDAADYACYCAPMFYELFPFEPGVERIFLRESRKLLRSL